MLNLSILLEDSARRFPDKIAFQLGEHGVSFSELDSAASRLAGALIERGVRPGDKVALSCPNLPSFPLAYYGILKAGAVVVPLNVLLKRDEVAYHLQDSEAVVYLCFEGTDELPVGLEGAAGFAEVDSCRHLIAITADRTGSTRLEAAEATLGAVLGASEPTETISRHPDDTAVILYTSGTTGRPKGAELTHSNLVMNTLGCRDLLQAEAEDTSLVALPLFHSFGQVVQMNVGVFCGHRAVLMPRFDPEAALHLMQSEGITVFAGVPTMYWALLNVPDAERFDLEAIRSKLRLCISGGASLPVQVLRDFEARYEVAILEGYGLSETSPVVSFNHLDRPRKPGTVGTPIWGVEVRIVGEDDRPLPAGEPGEIVVRGHNVMKGYYRRPEENAEALRGGWFHTGDVGTFDEDGYFAIVDRTKDMIIRGGYNVYPREVEERLVEHPEISLVSVVGVPDAEHGEEILAFVVLAEDSTLGAEEIIRYGREKMAAYKAPRRVEIRDALPMTATGKILKKELRKEVLS